MKPKTARKRQSKPKADAFTIGELAKAFGETVDTIRAQCKALTPVGKKGKAQLYNHSQVKDRLDKRIKRSGKSEEVKGSEQRKLDLQCRKLELDIEEREGKLLKREEVRSELAKFHGFIRARLVKFGGEISPALEGLSVPRIQKAIDKHVGELLKKLSEEPY